MAKAAEMPFRPLSALKSQTSPQQHTRFPFGKGAPSFIKKTFVNFSLSFSVANFSPNSADSEKAKQITFISGNAFRLLFHINLEGPQFM